MASLETIDRRPDPFDAEALAGVVHTLEVERLLRRLAQQRTGGDDIHTAFRPAELQNIRSFFSFANAARGRVVRPQRRRRAG